MLRTFALTLFRALSRVGADPLDSPDERLPKALLVSFCLGFIAAGAGWGIFYMLFAEPLPGLIPLGYGVFSAFSLLFYALTRRFTFFRNSQLILILILPFLLQLSLGGFTNASAVIIWSLLAPMGALVFDRPRRALYYFLAFLALVVLGGFLQPYVRPTNNLSPALVLGLFVMNIGAVSALAFFLLFVFVRQKNQFYDLLRGEQEKSENLLLNILPKDIAVLLKNGNQTIVDHYEGASVLFADLVGFTPLTAELPPAETLDLLNELFSYFDTLVERCGVEKIRTIGDSYMVAAGVPRPRHDHAQVLARLALSMLDYVRNRPAYNGRCVDFRIGISSGPLVAGVIGRKKFIYDIWGDSVNTASRMESHGTPGQIQISGATYDLIKDEFTCESRGMVNVKGKGEMETWYLLGPRPAPDPVEARPDVAGKLQAV